MPQLDEYLRQLAPSMTQWRRDFHLHAESGWLEFRTASKVADILDDTSLSSPLEKRSEHRRNA